MQTLSISPKVWQPAVLSFVSTAVGYIVTALANGDAANWVSVAIAIAGAALTAVQAIVGYVAPPGEVVPTSQPGFDQELPGGVTDEQRDAEPAVRATVARARKPKGA